MMGDNLRNALVRVWSQDMRQNYGNVVVAEVLRRPVDAEVRVGGVGHPHSFTDGAVLIDNDGSLGPLAAAMRGAHHVVVTIRQTTEHVWFPTQAQRNVMDYWTIEMVPWVEYVRASSKDDATIIREATQHHDR